jgi:hypothetical protein
MRPMGKKSLILRLAELETSSQRPDVVCLWRPFAGTGTHCSTVAVTMTTCGGHLRKRRPLKIQRKNSGSGNKCLRAIGTTTRSFRNWVRSAKNLI